MLVMSENVCPCEPLPLTPVVSCTRHPLVWQQPLCGVRDGVEVHLRSIDKETDAQRSPRTPSTKNHGADLGGENMPP